MPESRQHISIRIVHATPRQCFDQTLDVPAGSCLIDAIKASRLLRLFPELDLALLKTGIFGQRVYLDQQLHDGDRIEILRPLRQSPAAARRERAGKTQEN